ncbi:MAG: ABC transporter permease [Chloroflexota bacterium]
MTSSPDLTPTVIRPPARWPGFDLREVWRYRSLCMVLANRLLKVRYRQTVVGVGWAVGQPMLLMIMFSIVFGMIAKVPTQGVPFPVFYFSGLAIWQAVSKILSEGATSIVNNSQLVDRVYFPRVYLPASVAISSLVDLGCNLIALAVMVLWYGVSPSMGMVTLPILLAVAYASSMGITLWLGALNVEFRDVTVLLPVIIQLWFFASPIIYPAEIVPPEFQTLYYLNPMALAITGTRWAFAGTPPPPNEAWVLGIVVSVLVLVLGYVAFRRRQATFADLV